MNQDKRGFTLIELLVVIAIIALLISILLPSLSYARELAKRLKCQTQVKGMGSSCKIYSNDNYERWPVPPFDRSLPDLSSGESVIYITPGRTVGAQSYPGPVGMERQYPSFSVNPNASTQVSVTRAFWMLVRAGQVTVEQFVCPSSSDQADTTADIELYYDFPHYNALSYGYQVPFGPRDTQPRESMDSRQVVVADKGPFYLAERIEEVSRQGWQTGLGNTDVTLRDSPEAWESFNSPNHGGSGNGAGQSVLFADGHVKFPRTPTVGIDNDNIYTLIAFDWGLADHLNLIHGELPGEADPPPFPGQNALGPRSKDYASTDSLIYP